MTSPQPLPPHQDPARNDDPARVTMMEYVTTLIAQLDVRIGTVTGDLKESVAERFSASRRDNDGQFDVLRERLRGIDRATELLNATVTRVPTDLQREISHLRELTEERFRGVSTQFTERDVRQERERDDSKVQLGAAFDAQKETINKLQELLKSATDALDNKVDDLKERVVAMESAKRGGREQLAGIYALAGFLLALIALAGFLAATGAFDR